MENTVTIQAEPIILKEKQKGEAWELRKIIMDQDLECTRSALIREIEHNIPIYFSYEIALTIKANLNTMKVKIDYSAIKDKVGIKLLKAYFTKDKNKFYELAMNM